MKIPIILFFCFLFSAATSQCLQSFEYTLGNSTSKNIGYDVVNAGNGEFFLVGTSDQFSTNDDILITKMSNNGTLLWSKTYGGTGVERVRKANSTKDGGLVLAGQTTSFVNGQGDMLCMKINSSGALVWSKKFGLGSTYGDLAMDIIETSDGGYAVTGIINVSGGVADAVVIKLDINTNIAWCRRFDRGDGEDAVGILESGNTLLVTVDLQNSSSDYDALLMQMSTVDGTVIKSIQLNPASRGIFNPYIFKDNGNGYWISGHAIDQSYYTQMQQVVLKLDVNFSVTNTYKFNVSPYNDNYFTGFVPLANNSFFVCESPQNSSNGFIYHVGVNKKILSAKKFSGSGTRILNRLEIIGNKIVAVGRDGNNTYSNAYITCYDSSGIINSTCLPDTASLSVQSYTVNLSSFTWPSITNVSFSNTNITLTAKDVTLEKKELCSKSCDSLVPTCGNTWLNVTNYNGGVRIGDLDVSGNKITVEARFNRTIPYTRSRLYAGDIVSKHTDPTDANYILRPNSAEITTTNGYYLTPPICEIDTNKTYHVALVYDGSSLKFYRNGFLMSQMTATGNLVQNNLITTIGDLAYQPGYGQEGLIGYIDEVRIWNVARTQDEIKTYMNNSLPNPSTQNGLLAYYTFDNLKNKQGNSAWDGSLFGNATYATSNPTCSIYIADSCDQIVTNSPAVIPNFSLPDTVCVNTPIIINNLTKGGSNFYWNFCEADLNKTPGADNLDNPGNLLSTPVFIDMAKNDDGNYYAFSVNYDPGKLIRYNFGNSFLNTPTVEDLGNFGGKIPNQAEGVQIIKSNDSWYVVLVGGGNVVTNSSPRVVTIKFGSSLLNSGVATNWGNIGNLSQPLDLHVFQENNNWYGFTVNGDNNTITRFNFSENLDNAPTAVNLGNVGNLSHPTGIYSVNDNGMWRVFITNGGNNSRTSGTFSLSRLDFGNSLLNTPTGVNLGNPGNFLKHPRDLTIMKFCGEIIGFSVNGLMGSDDIVKMDFHNDLTSVPTLTSMGNIGGFNFPHSISKIFREDADLYAFITNVGNSTLSRLKFSGCTNSSLPNSSDSIPPTITYDSAGIYNIHLMVDEGLATQTSICKSIVVVAPPNKTPIFDTAFCANDSIILKTSFPAGTYTWNNGSTQSAITITQPGIYWVQSDYYGCTVRDSINTINSVSPLVNLGKDSITCRFDSVLLNAGNPGATYLWQDGTAGQTYLAKDSGWYYVRVTNPEGCSAKDSVRINNFAAINLKVSNDTTLCVGSQVSLLANGNNIQTYSWSPPATLSNPSIQSPVASPFDTTLYAVNVTDINGCKQSDSVKVNVAPLPTVLTLKDTSLCAGTNIILSTSATMGVNYSWSPSGGLSNSNAASPTASPSATTQYVVTVKTQANCKSSDTVNVVVNPLPALSASTLQSLICIGDSTSISATSPTAVSYTWTPAIGLNNPYVSTPTATPTATTNYHVQVADVNGCTSQDSVLVTIKQKPVFAIDPPNAGICTGESVTLTASGGDEYAWYPPTSLSNPNAAVTIASPTTSTTYQVAITDNICAVSDTLSTTVNITALTTIDVTKSNDVDCILGTTTLRATGGVIYNWHPATYLSDSSIASPTAAPLETTVYHVQVTNATGCTGTDSITVYVYKGEVANGYKLPSAFTPNNDGNNDCFGVRKWGTLSNLDFSVYDRWGVLLFHTKNPSDCWNGTYNGKPQPPGTYVYQIRAQALCGSVYRKGTVVLIR